MTLKRMLKVLIGSARALEIDHATRSIDIVKSNNTQTRLPSSTIKTIINNPQPSALEELVSVSITNELLFTALEKITPIGWKVKAEDNTKLDNIRVSVISENSTRKAIAEKVLADINANGVFYNKLKLLVISSNQQVIK